MQTAGSIDARLRDALTLRDVSTRALAKAALLAGIRNATQPQLDKAFSGKEPLQNETAEQLWALWQEITEMVHATLAEAPWVTMDLSNGERLFLSLQIFRGLQALKGPERSNSSTEVTNTLAD